MNPSKSFLARRTPLSRVERPRTHRVGHLNAGAEDATCTVQLVQIGMRSFLAWVPRRSRMLDRLRLGLPTFAWLEDANENWHEVPVHAREVSWDKLAPFERALLRQARQQWPQEWLDEVVVEVVVPPESDAHAANPRFRYECGGGVPRT